MLPRGNIPLYFYVCRCNDLPAPPLVESPLFFLPMLGTTQPVTQPRARTTHEKLLAVNLINQFIGVTSWCYFTRIRATHYILKYFNHFLVKNALTPYFFWCIVYNEFNTQWNVLYTMHQKGKYSRWIKILEPLQVCIIATADTTTTATNAARFEASVVVPTIRQVVNNKVTFVLAVLYLTTFFGR